jgi:hypothetical protein
MDNSNVDNEDSLNLTIGEEDEQLLRDEESENNDQKGIIIRNNWKFLFFLFKSHRSNASS